MAKQAKVIQDPEKKIPVEILAESIKNISIGVRKLREGPLNDRALFLLIQHASPGLGYSGSKIGIREIEAVFEGMENLEKTFLRKKGKDAK